MVNALSTPLSPAEFARLNGDYTRHVVVAFGPADREKAPGRTKKQDASVPLDPLGGILEGLLGKDRPTLMLAFELEGRLIAFLHLAAADAPIAQRVEQLRQLDVVEWADRNTRVAFSDHQVGDPLRASQWALDQIEAPAAWARLGKAKRPPVKIAIVDWGLFAKHEDLVDGRMSGFSVLPKGPGAKKRSGKSVAALPFDARAASGNAGLPRILKPLPWNHVWDDDNGHGTLLAGTVAAVTNTTGIAGISRNAEIVAIKFVDARTPPTALFAGLATLLAVCIGARVINASWDIGIDDNEFLRCAIKFAERNDVTFVAAAGNSGRNNTRDPVLPASYGFSNVISVMASNQKGEKPGFSNYGDNVDLAAPGVDVLSTHPYLVAPGQAPGRHTVQAYRGYSGTSAAAAHVTGALALLLSVDPDLKPSALREHLIASAMPTPELAGTCRAGGYLNLRRAVEGPFVVTMPRGGERLRRGTLCEVEWKSEYATSLILKRRMFVYDLDRSKPVGTAVPVEATGRMRFELPDEKVRRAVIRIASIPGRFYSDSAVFTVM